MKSKDGCRSDDYNGASGSGVSLHSGPLGDYNDS